MSAWGSSVNDNEDMLLNHRTLVFLQRRPCCCRSAGVVALLCGWINISGTVPIYYCLYTLCCVFMYLHVCCAVSVLALCGCTYYFKTLNIYIKIGNGGVRAPRWCTKIIKMVILKKQLVYWNPPGGLTLRSATSGG